MKNTVKPLIIYPTYAFELFIFEGQEQPETLQSVGSRLKTLLNEELTVG